ncbi:TRAP transporter small permease subunit [Mesorhizobium sp. WSM2561]|uniref:TRAP transporter small permease n=1 Tax=Mesorhizobium sp. WSM2561 TaxID=1040985 RepID=UPI0004AF7CD0|nr:TRAP transporter small permease subunit [Mesorhizobium sp. WSM2561]
MRLIERMLPVVDTVEGILRRVSEAIVVITVVVLLAALGVNVAMRYAFEQGGISWLSELPEHLFPWMVAAGVVLAALQGAHIAVDILLDVISERAAGILAVLIQLLIAVAYVVLAVVAVNVAQIASIEMSSLLRLPRSWGYYALVYMSVGVTVASLVVALRIAHGGRGAVAGLSAEESPL